MSLDCGLLVFWGPFSANDMVIVMLRTPDRDPSGLSFSSVFT